eukprot:8400714-Lingulodinium_polyedra.AAC.1
MRSAQGGGGEDWTGRMLAGGPARYMESPVAPYGAEAAQVYTIEAGLGQREGGACSQLTGEDRLA